MIKLLPTDLFATPLFSVSLWLARTTTVREHVFLAVYFTVMMCSFLGCPEEKGNGLRGFNDWGKNCSGDTIPGQYQI